MCDACEAVRINGLVCHEQGCPDSWKGVEVSCKWCGTMFIPESRNQWLCDETCAEYTMVVDITKFKDRSSYVRSLSQRHT